MEHQQTAKPGKAGAKKTESAGRSSTTRPQSVARQLQRGLGNQAVQRLIQAKLEVSQPGDPFEQEADRIAEQVLKMPAPGAAPLSSTVAPASQPSGLLQRKCSCGATAETGDGECTECAAKKPLSLQRQAAAAPAAPLTSSSPVDSVLSSSGHPLEAGTRTYMETRFGQDFSQVRVHTDTQAAASAHQLSALAYTSGSNVVFGSGQYTPETSAGKRLLAHELAHVVQQRSPSTPSIQRQQTHSPDAGMASAVAASQIAPAPTTESTTEPNYTPAGPPVLWGLDMSNPNLRTPYLSVTLPGHPLNQIANYLYGSPDFAAQLRAANGDLPDQVPAGRTFRPVPGRLTEAAQTALSRALEGGYILRSNGMPQEEGDQIRGVIITVGGQPMALTHAQYQGLLLGLATSLTRKADRLKDMAKNDLETKDYHVENTSSLMRGVSDWFADQDVPDDYTWTGPMASAQAIIDSLSTTNLTMDLIALNVQRLQSLEPRVNLGHRIWQRYITNTISGAERAIEVTKDVAFGLIVTLIAATIAPAVFTLAGGGAIGVVLGTGAAALAGGTVRAGLATGYAAATANPGEQVNYGSIALSNFGRGSVEGALAGLGALATPGVASGISGRLFNEANPALLSRGSRVIVYSATGAAVNASTGLAGSLITNLPGLASGKMSRDQYLHSAFWSTIIGGGVGAVFGGLGGLRTPAIPPGLVRVPPNKLSVPETTCPIPEGGSPAPVPIEPSGAGTGGGPRAPSIRTTVLSENAATGEMTVLGQNPETGQAGILRINTRTGTGTITDLLTGETFPIVGGRMQAGPAGLLGSGPQSTSLSESGPALLEPGVRPAGLLSAPEGSQIPLTPSSGPTIVRPSMFPPSTPESEAAAWNLIVLLDQAVATDPALAPNPRGIAVGVFYHADGTVTATVSGGGEYVTNINNALTTQGLPPGWRLGPGEVTPIMVSPLGMRPWSRPGSNIVQPGRPTCVEPRLSVGGRSLAPIEGMTVLQWRGNPLRFTDPATRIMQPCESCAINVDRIIEPIIVVPRR